MKKRYIIASYALLFLHVCAEEQSGSLYLKDEFNISAYWHEKMSWEEFLKIRNKLRREGLVKYVDKIEQQKMALEAGLEVPKTYIVSRDAVPLAAILSDLPSYVVKMTHLSLSQGLVLVKDGINMLTGKPITIEEVQVSIAQSLKKKPRKVESWALYQVQPGFMIQEYIPKRMEVKIQTIWGKAVIGELRGGESKSRTTPVWGRFDRDGKKVDGESHAPEWWPKAVAAAEKIAQGSDALRVDFLVKKGGELLLNELEIWPESNWSSMKAVLEKKLNAGYRNLNI